MHIYIDYKHAKLWPLTLFPFHFTYNFQICCMGVCEGWPQKVPILALPFNHVVNGGHLKVNFWVFGSILCQFWNSEVCMISRIKHGRHIYVLYKDVNFDLKSYLQGHGWPLAWNIRQSEVQRNLNYFYLINHVR